MSGSSPEISPVNSQVWRWDGVDVDHGFPIIGYIVATEDGVVLVDPPMTSGTVEEIRACGEPQAIFLTSRWHVRGAGQWKERLDIPIIAPNSAQAELAEVNAQSDRTVSEADKVMGWDVLRFESKNGEYDELAYWHPATGTIIIGDLFTQNNEGQIVFGPTVFMNVDPSELKPMVGRIVALQPKLLLSAHIGPIEDVDGLLRQFSD